MRKDQISKLIHDSHQVLSNSYGDLDDRGGLAENSLEHWNYQRNVAAPIARAVTKYLSRKSFVMLDAGCGNGQLFHLYWGLGAKVIYGVDFGSSMLRRAVDRARINNISFFPIKATLEDLACVKENSFDLINLYGVMEHLPDPARVLRELENVLAPKGILIMSIPRKWSLAWITYFLFCRSLAGYAGQETRLEGLLRRKKMLLYKFYTQKEINRLVFRKGSFRLLERIPMAHGGIVGSVDAPLRYLARKGNYKAIDLWNRACKSVGLVPAGEYLVLGKG
jgi:2-polyprenyl-3-methyl-5-hydroxy-6-metoxy-1,4-benzoquinol methylase